MSKSSRDSTGRPFSETTTSPGRERVAHEVADVAIALLLFCDRAGIDLLDAVEGKIEVNAGRYPVEVSRGRSERPDNDATGSAS